MTIPRLSIAFAATALVLLTGCAGPATDAVEPSTPPVAGEPSASAEPEEPAADVISPAGYGELEVGQAVPSDYDRATWNADFCGDNSGAWVTESTNPDHEDFVIRTLDTTEDGAVTSVIAYAESIETPEGIHPGSTFDEVEAAYPGLEEWADDIDLTDIYYVTSDAGQLVFEGEKGAVNNIKALAFDVEPYGVMYSGAGRTCTA